MYLLKQDKTTNKPPQLYGLMVDLGAPASLECSNNQDHIQLEMTIRKVILSRETNTAGTMLPIYCSCSLLPLLASQPIKILNSSTPISSQLMMPSMPSKISLWIRLLNSKQEHYSYIFAYHSYQGKAMRANISPMSQSGSLNITESRQTLTSIFLAFWQEMGS